MGCVIYDKQIPLQPWGAVSLLGDCDSDIGNIKYQMNVRHYISPFCIAILSCPFSFLFLHSV